VGRFRADLWLDPGDIFTRLTEPRVLLVLALITAAAALVARYLRGSVVVAVLASVSLWPVFAVTLLNRGGASSAAASGLGTCVVTDPRGLAFENLGNLMLLLPFAFLAATAVGRPLLVTATCLVISLSLEATQAMFTLGSCDSSDVVRNTAGALAGALVGVGLRACPRDHVNRQLRARIKDSRRGGAGRALSNGVRHE
jgi:VanZ like family